AGDDAAPSAIFNRHRVMARGALSPPLRAGSAKRRFGSASDGVSREEDRQMAHETTYDTLGQSSAKLHPSIEVVEGMDRATLLYDARTKNYARIGDTAAKVVA